MVGDLDSVSKSLLSMENRQGSLAYTTLFPPCIRSRHYWKDRTQEEIRTLQYGGLLACEETETGDQAVVGLHALGT